MNSIKLIQKRLFEMQDVSYREFQAKLMPTVDKDKIIGVRTPDLRKYASVIIKCDYAETFIECIPHQYYEEDNLHAFLLEKIKDYDTVVKRLDEFLPLVDNWATCDSMSPKVFKKHLPQLDIKMREWISSDETYVCRFGLKMIMNYFLDDAFKKQYLDIVASVKSEEYYVNMMRAWVFATALSKQYDSAVEFFEQKILDKWTHNKSIQKAIESYRVTDEHKNHLRLLKY